MLVMPRQLIRSAGCLAMQTLISAMTLCITLTLTLPLARRRMYVGVRTLSRWALMWQAAPQTSGSSSKCTTSWRCDKPQR